MEVRLGTPTDYLVLSEYPYLIRFDSPTPADGATVRVVASELQIVGSTPDDLWDARQAVQAMLNRAADAIRRNRPMAERVSFQVRLDTTEWVYVDVRSGELSEYDIHATGISAYCTMTLACLPLLRGDALQAQNLLAAPCDPEDAVWTLTNVTATSNNATAPDGSQTAARLRETSATGMHELVQGIAKPAESAPYTLSAYVKSDGRSAVSLYLADGSGTNGAYVGFDVVAGYRLYPANVTGTGFSAPDASIENANDGWYRVSLTATVNTDTELRAYIQLHNGAGTSYAGNASLGLLVWGAQLEEGDRAGLLLVPQMLPDTVTSAYTIPAYLIEATSDVIVVDADNVLGSGDIYDVWQGSEAPENKPGGGSGARRATDNSNNTPHYLYLLGGSVGTLPAGTNTLGIYLKPYGSATHSRVLFSGGTNSEGYQVTVDHTAGTITGPTLRGGTGYSNPSAEIIVLSGGWVWVGITQTMSATSAANVYVTYGDWNATQSYAGGGRGVIVYAAQMVTGATIDKPTAGLPEQFVPEQFVPAVLESTGLFGGAYVYGVPGDAPAIYRAELDDESASAAVNRLHLGAWSGRDVRLGQPGPLLMAEAGDGASTASGIAGQVGELIATLPAVPEWGTVATVPLTDLVGRRGLASIVARVQDGALALSQPQSARVEVQGGAYLRRVTRVGSESDTTDRTSLDVGMPVITPGRTLILLTQGFRWRTSPSDTGTSTATITSTGGQTWTLIHSGAHRGAFAVWVASNVVEWTGTLTVGFAPAVKYATATLLEMVGAASSGVVESTRTDAIVSSRLQDPELEVTVGPLTNVQHHVVYLSVGLGLNTIGGWRAVLTTPRESGWTVVSSLSTGAVAYQTFSSSAARSVTWWRAVDGSIPEDWFATLAVLKAASTEGSSLTPGQWSLCVTAVDALGNESLPTGTVSANVPAASSSVALEWTPPAQGTPAKYRVYRNRGSGWGYVEVTAPATSYLWTSEAGITNADPPSVAPPVTAWRASVALPSGTTIWRGLPSVASRIANGTWEDIALGDVPLPPIPAGESETPDGARLVIEAAHLTGAVVMVNGVWMMDRSSGQVLTWRERLASTDPINWVVETNRDEISAAWLRDDAGNEAGQADIQPGVMTLAPGNALVVIRPEIAGGVSALTQSDLRLRRLLVTPRYTWLRGRR